MRSRCGRRNLLEAARLGRRRDFPLRADWDEVKDAVMHKAVLCKFETHADIRAILLASGDEELIEDTSDDYYWGRGSDGSGKNMLGQVLVQVRQILRIRAQEAL